MDQQKPTKRLVRYWQPEHRKGGGWHYGYAIDLKVDDNGIGIWTIKPIKPGKNLRLTDSNVEEVTQ